MAFTKNFSHFKKWMARCSVEGFATSIFRFWACFCANTDRSFFASTLQKRFSSGGGCSTEWCDSRVLALWAQLECSEADREDKRRSGFSGRDLTEPFVRAGPAPDPWWGWCSALLQTQPASFAPNASSPSYFPDIVTLSGKKLHQENWKLCKKQAAKLLKLTWRDRPSGTSLLLHILRTAIPVKKYLITQYLIKHKSTVNTKKLSLKWTFLMSPDPRVQQN